MNYLVQLDLFWGNSGISMVATCGGFEEGILMLRKGEESLWSPDSESL